MIYKFNNYAVIAARKENGGRIYTVFELFAIKNPNSENYIKVITNIYTIIDFIEVLRAFTSKKLEEKKEYDFEDFTAKLVKKNGITSLKIKFDKYWETIYYDKIGAITLAAKLNKIINKCEIEWLE